MIRDIGIAYDDRFLDLRTREVKVFENKKELYRWLHNSVDWTGIKRWFK